MKSQKEENRIEVKGETPVRTTVYIDNVGQLRIETADTEDWRLYDEQEMEAIYRVLQRHYARPDIVTPRTPHKPKR